MRQTPLPLVIIGASTGGTRVLPHLLARMGSLRAGVLIVQHMPGFISGSFAQTLGRYSRMPVKLAEEGDVMEAGRVYLAPGDRHCVLGHNHCLHLNDGPKVNFVRPSVDVTFLSVGQPVPPLTGIILTGMGHDGAKGLIHLKKLGARTLVQEERSCAVFGMPKHAIESGCVDHVLSPDGIADWLSKAWGVGLRAEGIRAIAA